MKRGKRVYWLVPLFAVLAALTVRWLTGDFALQNAKPLQAQTDQPVGIDVLALESQMGLSFVAVDPAQIEVDVISQDEAIAKAQEEKPRTSEASRVIAELGTLSGTPNGVVINNLQEQHLVWFVSFQGVTSYASGEPGANNSPHIVQEYNVVIDAATGERLFSLVYRRFVNGRVANPGFYRFWRQAIIFTYYQLEWQKAEGEFRCRF